ncbi:unnamed protein product [Brassica napus]|uniref:(rape) hypothetical protein n=1 Tax=Brassica napus TaxID=3708 RepID=A0A816TRE4_BRANA|nr:unnamed protein product [Brassica napus]
MANPSIILSDFQACCCSSTVKVSDFVKLARWRADGVDVLLLSLKLKLSSRRSMIFVLVVQSWRVNSNCLWQRISHRWRYIMAHPPLSGLMYGMYGTH